MLSHLYLPPVINTNPHIFEHVQFKRVPRDVKAGQPLFIPSPCEGLAVLYSFSKPREDSQEWLSYKVRVFTARSSCVRTIRGQRRPNTSHTSPAAITISINKRSDFASGAASSEGH